MKTMKRVLNSLNGNKRGFTLIEVLVVIGIVGTLSLIMSMTINMVRNSTRDTTARNTAMTQVHLAADWIARDIESSSGSIVTTAKNPATAPNPLMLCQIMRYSWQGTVMSTENITYVVNNTTKQLLRQVDGSSGILIARGFSSDNLTRVDSETLGSNRYIIKLTSEFVGEGFSQQYKVSRRAP
jgi:prepilin-type N-terminal cleavage/methylation domain-containing protein